MKMNVMTITAQGMTRSFSKEAWVIAAIEKGLEGTVSEADIELQLERYDQRVVVDVRLSFTGSCACMRCASPLTIRFSKQEELMYDPVEDIQKTAEEELELEDLDLGWYEDGKIDLSVVICEAVVLSLPEKMHCGLDIVVEKPEGNCYTSPQIEERRLENMFANILKKQ